MKLRIIILLGVIFSMVSLIGAGCGGGSSAPITPAQIPTSVEYAGGAVEGDISVLTSKTFQFVAKDTDGNLADASEIVTTLATPSANVAEEPGTSISKSSVTGDEYGTCALDTSNSSYINCTGPSVLPTTDYNPRVNYSFAYGDTTLTTSTGTGYYTGRLVVSADTINSGQYSFSRAFTASNCMEPRVTSNGIGWVIMSCMYVITPGNSIINIYWSNDDGATWSGPEVVTGVSNDNVIKALKTTESVNTVTAYLAYNGANNMMYIRQITGDASGNITVGAAKSVSGAVYDIAVDVNGNAYIVNSSADSGCPYEPNEYIAPQLQYREVTSDGGFGIAHGLSTTCTAKANPGAAPRIAVTPDGSLAYITWRDIGSGGDPSPDVTYVKVAEINTSKATTNWETTVAATSSASANSVQSAGQYAATDRNGNMALTWDESASTTSTTMRTFLSTLDGSTDAFTSYLVSTMTGISNNDPLLYSGTAMQIDYAGAYHMFYRNLGLLYSMGTISSGSLTTTTAIDLATTGTFPFGAPSTDTDWSGKNFIAWQEQAPGSMDSIVAIGTTD